MSNAPATNQNEPKKAADGGRQPIGVERLLIAHSNPNGVNVPFGEDGKSSKIQHTIRAGIEGDIKTEIDFMPWMQTFRVKRSKRHTRTGQGDKEIETWSPMGKPYYLPQTWAVWVPAGE